MRVLLDVTYARRAPISGTGVYIENLCRELEQIGGVEVVTVSNPSRRPPAGGGLGSLRNLGSDFRFSTVGLRRAARRGGAQLIHHTLPGPPTAVRLPQVVTFTDLAYERLPHMFDRRYRRYAQLVHRATARRAAAVICISQTTAADVSELWGVPPERVVVAHLGPGQELPPVPRAGAPEHFLYVGDQEPRKNLGVLLDAYQRYRERLPATLGLVLAGAFDQVPAGAGPGVTLAPRPSPARLAELHARAAALVHPSRYEGFGLTALEAMSAGTPVLAARAPGVSEVCGDAALYADADDPEAFAQAMAALGGDQDLRRRLRELGRARIGRFSWQACARAHLEAYSLALGG